MQAHLLPLAVMTALAVQLSANEPAAPTPHRGIEAFLSFTNGDQLHGHYLGFSENRRLRWLRDDLADTPEFELSNIRRVILRNGRPDASVATAALADTIHGDRIPGEIIMMDQERVVIDTNFGGTVTIPRDRIEVLAPNPYGGRIFYQGPFLPDEWEMLEPMSREAERRAQVEDGQAVEAEESDGAGWQHTGAAWYWTGEGSPVAMVRREGMPDSAVMRFHVSWKSRISLAFAFHADFHRPEPVAEDEQDGVRNRARRFHPGDTGVYPEFFGNSYVLQLNPTHAMMLRSSIDENGKTSVDRMQTNFNNVRLGDSGSANVEIRASRISGDLSLFINDEFVAQWSEIGHLREDAMASPYAGKGGGFGFYMQSRDAIARVSDITVSEWHGMPDAARSMQVDEHDVVLLINGTDRFSGKVNAIADGRLTLTGRYGDFNFPIDEVAQIRFARASLQPSDRSNQDRIRVRLHPHGVITGVPVAGDDCGLRLTHPSAGEVDIDLSTAIILDLREGLGFLDGWDPNF